MSRAYTLEEAREQLLQHIAAMSRYWAAQPNKTALERCNGLAFSILSVLDGAAMAYPAIDLMLSPHAEDRAFAEEEGENWFQPGQIINECQLHELWDKYEHKEVEA